MATLDVTSRRLHPRDGFPIASPRMSSTLVILLSRCSHPSTDGTSGRSGKRTLDDKQRLTRPLHLGEDSNPSSVEDVRLEGGGLSWISRATRRSSPL
ncbi:hypothetical protein DPMN_181989 [Dreissena polymorpha]|uniref:Uncharacterized protein n=1 Tax=Dreissena polymorpha TaxID=45954 RepID=A0A9D4DGA6_DREPO|nr:hypothetical protein DPMN_181989 [Dreissena polymorpha]